MTFEPAVRMEPDMTAPESAPPARPKGALQKAFEIEQDAFNNYFAARDFAWAADQAAMDATDPDDPRDPVEARRIANEAEARAKILREGWRSASAAMLEAIDAELARLKGE
jgi:hypothetical protein